MRTTVTLDPDVEQLVRERMTATNVSFEQAANDAIRESAPVHVDFAFSTTAVDLGPPKSGIAKASQLAGDLEDDELAGKMERGQ